jgi:hypothetical protein
MELANTTPVPAHLAVMDGGREDARGILLVAKATFRVEGGRVVLDDEAPLPVLAEDVETPLGVLPRDVLPKLDAGFEVMVLGHAVSPTGAPVTTMEVALGVGDVRRTLAVSGDRFWEGTESEARIGPAAAFERMPLTWERAFGGSVEVEIDDGALLDVAYPLNRGGRGFEHRRQALELGELFKSPEGYPRFPAERPLANIEDPAAPVTAWDDEPLPVCWAPTPAGSGMLVERLRRAGRTAAADGPVPGEPLLLERAHPDWVVAPPPPAAKVELVGMSPAGVMRFRLPEARVLADVAVGDETAVVELRPRALVILADEARFCLVFRGGRVCRYAPDETRGARIRLARGWAPATEREVARP